MKDKILEILTRYEVNEENQAGTDGGVIWDTDFNELAEDLVKFCNLHFVSNHVVCDKCNDTGVIWSSDKLSARTCGCK